MYTVGDIALYDSIQSIRKYFFVQGGGFKASAG